MDYLIKNTTKEQRKELVKKALAISASGADMPSNETLLLVNDYIEGKKELKEVLDEVIERYKK